MVIVWHGTCLYSSVTKKQEIMTAQNNAIFTCIKQLFEVLGKNEQVDLMVSLYYSMYDEQKDKFLHKTENA